MNEKEAGRWVAKRLAETLEKNWVAGQIENLTERDERMVRAAARRMVVEMHERATGQSR